MVTLALLPMIEIALTKGSDCAGAWVYNSSIWPPHDLWSRMLTADHASARECSLSLHNVTFHAATNETMRLVRAAKSESASAGTERAHGGRKRDKAPNADMKYAWGEQVWQRPSPCVACSTNTFVKK